MKSLSVFLSYTGTDNVIARRVYNDLKRSGYDVWSYEADGLLGENYATDYQRELNTRSIFCLLDSPNSRKSLHVQRECKLARLRQERDSHFAIIPCLILDRTPNWFDSELLFPEQPMVQYINLSQDYQAGMERLCKHLGGRKFFPFSDLPEDNDFLEEISSSPNIPLRIYDELTGMYRRFRDDCGKDPSGARSFILAIINVIQKSGSAGIATPWIALGVIESESGNYASAVMALEEATLNRPDSDRSWCAKASANMALGNYSQALRDYRTCRDLLVDGHPNLDNLPMVVFGIVAALLKQNAWIEALQVLDGEWERIEWHGRILQLRAQLLLQNHRPDLALPLLVGAREFFEAKGNSVPIEIFLLLAQAYRELKRGIDEQKVVSQAVSQFENDPESLRSIADQMVDGMSSLPIEFLRIAVQVNPNSFVYRGELASILYALGQFDEATCEVEPCLYLEDELNRPITPRERYYQGLAFWILGQHELAEHAIKRARRQDRLISDWPDYEKLLRRGN